MSAFAQKPAREAEDSISVGPNIEIQAWRVEARAKQRAELHDHIEQTVQQEHSYLGLGAASTLTVLAEQAVAWTRVHGSQN